MYNPTVPTVRPRDLVLLFSLAAIWGASYLFIKVAVAELSPVALVAGRLGLGAVGLGAVAWAGRDRDKGSVATPSGLAVRPLWLRAIILGLFGAVIPWLLIAWGEIHITSGEAAILNATAPFFSTVFGHLLGLWGDEERLTLDRAAGLLLGTAGVFLLVWGGMGEADGEASLHLLGSLAVLLSSVSYGVGALFARLAFAGSHALVPATAQNVGGALLVVPAAVVFAVPEAMPSPQAIASVLALGLAGTVVAYILYYELVDRLGASGGLSVTYLVPAFALVYGALLLGEPVAPAAIGGLLLILAGVGLTTGTLRLPRRAG